MPDEDIAIRVEINIAPIGQAPVELGLAHPSRMDVPEGAEDAAPVTNVLPGSSSSIAPGYIRLS